MVKNVVAGNEMDLHSESKTEKNSSTDIANTQMHNNIEHHCPSHSELKCSELPVSCLNCVLGNNCRYGATLSTTCEKMQGIICLVIIFIFLIGPLKVTLELQNIHI